MSVVDDFGRFYGSIATIRASCWPTCPDKVTEKQVGGWLAECYQGDRPLLVKYSVDGADYLYITDFNQQTRTKSKYPMPPLECDISVREFCDQNDIKPPADGQQKTSASRCKYSEAESKSLFDAESGFIELWQLYPRDGRTKQVLAQQYYVDEVRSQKTHNEIIAAVKGKWLKSKKWKDGYILNLPEWIHNRCWEEDPPPPTSDGEGCEYGPNSTASVKNKGLII